MFFWGVALLLAVRPARSEPVPKLVNRLQSEEPQVRKEAEKQIIEDHQQTIAVLEGLIEDSLRGDYASTIMSSLEKGKAPDPKYLAAASAMKILGELRAARSVPLLVDHLRFSITRGPVSPRPPVLKDFPAAEALVKIGLPSVQRVLDQYKIRGHEVGFRFLTARIIRDVLGKDLAKRYLENSLAAEGDLVKKDRLKELLKSY